MRDGMPRAYLRVDPNLDNTHPDVDGFVRLLCAAARQPDRGRFKDRALLVRAIGPAKARKAMDRGDVVTLQDGRLYVDGWDEWQEGDHTVADRMKRMRAKRRAKRDTTVTPDTVPPSPRRLTVTTDAVPTVSRSSLGVGDSDETPPPPTAVGAEKRRKDGSNPRATGDAPRQNGTAPRQLGESPRQEREAQKRGPTKLGEILQAVARRPEESP